MTSPTFTGKLIGCVQHDCDECKSLRTNLKHTTMAANAEANEVDRCGETIAALRTQNQALREALKELVDINEKHNSACAEVIGYPMGWKDDYLDAARAALAEEGV